jgi:hypothetical protein
MAPQDEENYRHFALSSLLNWKIEGTTLSLHPEERLFCASRRTKATNMGTKACST